MNKYLKQAYLDTRSKMYWQEFMSESNSIEGEQGLNPGDKKAFELALKGIKTQEDIKKIHKILTAHLNVNWSGKYRDCQVYVGNYIAPSYTKIPKLMKQYIKDLPHLNSWEAHNRFETIHPFQDFNGRMGRLIWASKACEEGYSFILSFLHKYYYQTLENYQKGE